MVTKPNVMTMIREEPEKSLIICGKSTSGKTTLVNHIIKDHILKDHEVLIVDPNALVMDWPRGALVVGMAHNSTSVLWGQSALEMFNRKMERLLSAQNPVPLDTLVVLSDLHSLLYGQKHIARGLGRMVKNASLSGVRMIIDGQYSMLRLGLGNRKTQTKYLSRVECFRNGSSFSAQYNDIPCYSAGPFIGWDSAGLIAKAPDDESLRNLGRINNPESISGRFGSFGQFLSHANRLKDGISRKISPAPSVSFEELAESYKNVPNPVYRVGAVVHLLSSLKSEKLLVSGMKWVLEPVSHWEYTLIDRNGRHTEAHELDLAPVRAIVPRISFSSVKGEWHDL